MATAEPSGTEGLHFVVSNNVEKPDPKLRKFIRRHVMLGKNRGKTRVVRNKEASKAQDGSLPGSEASPKRASGHERHLVGPSTSTSALSHPVLPVVVPRKFGSDLAGISFADAVEPGKIEVVLQFSSIAKQVLFPLETCIHFERRAEGWIAPIAVDPAYLHAVIVMSHCFFDAMLPQKVSPINQRALPHVLKALQFLRERLASEDDQASLSNTTAAAVVNLAGYAFLTGDYDTAKHHMEGLWKIVRLRGGVATFRDNTKLLVEILRCDLTLALQKGSKPVFFEGTSSQDRFLPYPDQTSLLNLRTPATTCSGFESAIPFTDMDDELACAWMVMSDFCAVINFATESGSRISTNIFLDTMASVMYRLLDMRFGVGSNDELTRLGLLALAYSVFLPRNYPGTSQPYFAPAFRGCLATLHCQVSPHLLLWFLMVGAISVFDTTDDAWLKGFLLINTRLCNIDSWRDMQDVLKSFMWVNLVHDKPGKEFFDNLVSSSRS